MEQIIMDNRRKVFIIKFVHSVIYLFMVTCMAYIFYCAAAQRYDWTLPAALGFIALEVITLLINKGTCPFTPIAEKYGAERGSVTDIFFPMWCAKHTFRVSTVVVIVELIWLAIGYFT
jgi:hypothetical protein